jgi:aminoglycoside phosphotransferase
MVLAITRKFIPGAKAVTAIDESGGEARTYFIDNNFVLKVQRPHRLRPRTNLEKEVCFLNQLATNQRISVPKVLGYGREEPNIEYILMTRMPGKAFRYVKLEGEVRKTALHALGQTIRLIHQLDQEPLITSNLIPGDQSFAEFKARIEELFTDTVAFIESRIAEKKLDLNLKVSPYQIAETALDRLPNSEVRIALHSNPGPEHTFVNPSANTFSGLIDFGDAYISHPALDLRRWPYPQDRTVILEGYVSIGPVTQEFLKTWQIVMILTDLATLANASDPELIQAVQKDLQAKLAEK